MTVLFKWNVNFVSIDNNQSEVQSSNYYSNKTKALKVKVGADYNVPPHSINNQNTKTALNVKTIDPDTLQYLETPHYNAHNLFGEGWKKTWFVWYG